MRAQAAAQLAVHSARFSACAGFGSPSVFLHLPAGLSIPPQFEAAARQWPQIWRDSFWASAVASGWSTHPAQRPVANAGDVSNPSSDFRPHQLASSGHSKAEPLAPLRSATDTAIRSDGRCFGKLLPFIFLVARLSRVLAHCGDHDSGFSAMKPAISAATRSPWPFCSDKTA